MKFYLILSNCCDAFVNPAMQGVDNPEMLPYECTDCGDFCDGYLWREDDD